MNDKNPGALPVYHTTTLTNSLVNATGAWKTRSSISALRRHPRDGVHCRLIKMAKETAQNHSNTEATEPATSSQP